MYVSSTWGGWWSGNDGAFAYYSTTATQGQTIFNIGFTYTNWNNNLFVFANWLKMQVWNDYTETSGTSITFNYWLNAGDIIQVIYPNKGLNWKGTYSGATAYVKDDAVFYDGNSYICKLATTWNLPTNITYWDLLAQKWDTGLWDVNWPSSAISENIVIYDWATGKVIKDGWKKINDFYDKTEINNLLKNVWLNLFTLTETVVINSITYVQSCLSRDDSRYTLATTTELTTPAISTTLNWIWAVSDENVFSSLPETTATVHLYARKSNVNADVNVQFNYYKLTNTWITTLIWTSSIATIDSTTTKEYNLTVTLTPTNFSSTDRLLRIPTYTKVWWWQDPTVSVSVEWPSNYTFITIPVSTQNVSIAHNDTTGKQWGTTWEYYHLNLSQYNVVVNTSWTNTGDQTITTWTITATEGQTAVTVWTHIVNSTKLIITLNWLEQTLWTDYTDTSTTQITFTSWLLAGDKVKYKILS